MTARTKQEKANLRLVARIYQEVLGPIDSSAVDALFDPGYIQHNPNAATGSAGLKEMLDRAKVKYPKAEHRVKRMLADGDLVAAHVHVIFQPGDAGFAVVKEPWDAFWGQRYAIVSDPDGYTIDLFAAR